MGYLARVTEGLVNLIPTAAGSSVQVAESRWNYAALPDDKYRTYAAEGYQKNELVFAAIEELATSAAEPSWKAMYQGKWVFDHPILELVNRPNPFMHRYEFWATVMLHRALAGNAYALIVRSGSGRPLELWLLRPDRVKIHPHPTNWISHYEYDIGTGEPMRFPPEDVIHWKTRHPLNDYYGMPPLMAAAGRVDIDNFMKDFVKTYLNNMGVPAGVLEVEGKVSPEMRTEIQGRWRSDYGGGNAGRNLLVLQQMKAKFTPLTASLGDSGLVIPELDEISEARIMMVFQVPPELIGARVGMQGSSYDAKRAARESFWDETLIPIYADLAGSMNLRLVPNYPRVTEVAADVSQVRALLEDADKLHMRVRQDVLAGIITVEEARDVLEYGDMPGDGTLLVPSNMTATPVEKLGEEPTPPPTPALPAPPQEEPVASMNGRHA